MSEKSKELTSISRWDGWDGVLTPSLGGSPEKLPWSRTMSPSRYDEEVLRVIRRAEQLAIIDTSRMESLSSSQIGSLGDRAEENCSACAIGYVAYVLMTEVISSMGVATPWGADIMTVVAELRNLIEKTVSSGVLAPESLARLQRAAQAQRPREPGPVILEDLCASLFEPSVGLTAVLSRGGLTAGGLKGVLRAARPVWGSLNQIQPNSSTLNDQASTLDRADPFGYFKTGTGQSSGSRISDAEPATSMLERFGTDLVALAAEGKLDAVFGRDQECDRILRVLARRNKPNVCIVGPPGVGKTAVVEEIARRIHERRIPKQLMTCKRVIQLSLGSMVGGTRYRGDFEQRMQTLLRELEDAGDTVILFIDELHMAMGAGETEKGGSMDAANLLKPALARRQIRCIGATTTADYQRLIQGRDKAFERRFVTITLQEPTEAAAKSMLDAFRPAFEKHHGVQLAPDTIQAAVIASRILHGRSLPDRALDILDDAATLASMEDQGAHGDTITICRPRHAYQVAKEANVAATTRGKFSSLNRWLPWSRL